MAQSTTSTLAEDQDLEGSDLELDEELEPESTNKSMSVAGVVSFLRNLGIPEQFCEAVLQISVVYNL